MLFEKKKERNNNNISDENNGNEAMESNELQCESVKKAIKHTLSIQQTSRTNKIKKL